VRRLRHDAKARPKQLICKIEPFPEWESEFPRRGSHFASYAEVKGSLASVKAADELHFLTGQPLSICQKLLSGHRVENRDMIIALFQTHLVVDVILGLIGQEVSDPVARAVRKAIKKIKLQRELEQLETEDG
jgi:hypothetical protein